MTKQQFRLLLVSSIVLAFLAAFYDYLWIDPITQKVIDYAYEIEPDYISENLILTSVLMGLTVVFGVVSFIGLLLFKSWARHIYLLGFIVLFPLYPYMGIAVYGGFGQALYDLSMLCSGAILALIYYSPVKNYFENRT